MTTFAPDEQHDDNQASPDELDKFIQAYLHGVELRGRSWAGLTSLTPTWQRRI